MHVKSFHEVDWKLYPINLYAIENNSTIGCRNVVHSEEKISLKMVNLGGFNRKLSFNKQFNNRSMKSTVLCKTHDDLEN